MHHRNFDKRLVKTPKLYFYDPGLAARLLGVHTADQLAIHPQRGALFESWVLAELLKARHNHALDDNLYFWRDRTGHEVDLLIDQGTELIPVESKSGLTLSRAFFTGLRKWREIAGDAAERGWLVYGGDRRQSRQDVEVLPWREIGELGETLA